MGYEDYITKQERVKAHKFSGFFYLHISVWERIIKDCPRFYVKMEGNASRDQYNRLVLYQNTEMFGSVGVVVPRGSWLVIHSNKEVTIMSDEDFKETYIREA